MKREQTVPLSENKVLLKKNTGRPRKRVSAENIHKIVNDLTLSDNVYLKKDDYRYDYRAKYHLTKLVNELDKKGYREHQSPARVKRNIEHLFEKLAQDGVSEEQEAQIKKQIKKEQKCEFQAEEADIEKLQSAIDDMGPDFWKRYQANLRQTKHKNKKKKVHLSIDTGLMCSMSDEKDSETWDEYLSKIKNSHAILLRLMNDMGCNEASELVAKLEETKLIEFGFKSRYPFDLTL